MSSIVEVRNIRKVFKDVVAVDDISFTVEKGDVFGFLGPNGAGKSTTIRMITSLISPTSGDISIFGHSLVKEREKALRSVGAIIEKPDFYLYLTAYKNLEIVARMYGVDATSKKISELLEMVGLAERAQSKVKTFSYGMKQRLGIACALIHNPELVILDEPTNGLDPQGVKEVREIILRLSEEFKKTVLISSHILHEIEMTANRMAIINKGKIVVAGDVQALLSDDEMDVELRVNDVHKTSTLLQERSFACMIESSELGIVHTKGSDADVSAIVSLLVQNNVQVSGVIPKRSLEEYFIKMVSESESLAPAKKGKA